METRCGWDHQVILPEHRDLIMERKQKERLFHPPELAVDALMEINQVVERSRSENQPITITYAGKYGPKQFVGVVTRVDPIERWLVIQNGEDKRLIPLSQIIGAEEVTAQ